MKSPNTNRLPPLPTSISVLGVRFRVLTVDGIDNNDTAGDTVGLIRRIRADGNLDRSKQWRTLLHEYVHGCLHVVGVDAVLPDGIEEVIAQTMEHGMEQLLRQVGPQLLQALTVDDRG
jgi:ssRNA-specific RNase YbeY (16S rRNA maturation enzyme)